MVFCGRIMSGSGLKIYVTKQERDNSE